MERVPCPGLPSGTICDNEGFCQQYKNGYRRKKNGELVQKYRIGKFCKKHIAEFRKSNKKPVCLQLPTQLRPVQSTVVKEQAKQIRNLEQKLKTAQDDLQDYKQRSVELRKKHRRISGEFEHQVRNLQADQHKLVECYEGRLAHLQTENTYIKDRMSSERDKLKLRIERHTKHRAGLIKKLAHCTQSMRASLDKQVQLEKELEACESALQDATRPSARKRVQYLQLYLCEPSHLLLLQQHGDPQKNARKRAVMLIENYIHPRGWDADDTLHVLGKVAQALNLDVSLLMEASTDKRTVSHFPVLSTSEASQQHQSAFSMYLQRMDPAILADIVPDKVRQLLITRYVEKVQEFWSVERCALIKYSLRISERNWVWMRQLLGRTVTDEGKLVDHCIDTVPIPMLVGKNAIIKHAKRAGESQSIAAPDEHRGLVSYRNARYIFFTFPTHTVLVSYNINKP